MTRRAGKKISGGKQHEVNTMENFTLSPSHPERMPESKEPFGGDVSSEANGKEDAPERIAEIASSEQTGREAVFSNEKPDEAGEEAVLPPSVGVLLRQAREAAGLTVDSVAVSLKLAPRQIVALENDEYAKLPARTFVRGFVRNYARLLNIDPNTALAALPPEPQAEISPAAISVKLPMSSMPSLSADNDFPRTQRKIWRWLIVLMILALFFIVLLFKPKIEAWLESLQEMAAPKPVAEEVMPQTIDLAEQILPPSAMVLLGEETAPLETSPSLPISAESTGAPVTMPDVTEAPATTLSPPLAVVANGSAQPLPGDAELEMIFDGQSWVEVRDADNKSLFYGLAQGGEQKKLYGKAPLSVVLGKGEAVRVNFRGHPVGFKISPNDGVTRLTLE